MCVEKWDGCFKIVYNFVHTFIDNTMMSTKSFQLGFKLSHRILIEIKTAFSVSQKLFFPCQSINYLECSCLCFILFQLLHSQGKCIISCNVNIYMTSSGGIDKIHFEKRILISDLISH